MTGLIPRWQQSEGDTYWAEHEAEEQAWRRERKLRRRLRRTYGTEGLNAIAELALRALVAHPGMPDERAWAWAEAKYERGEVLC